MQPRFVTARLRLTPAGDEDVDGLWALWTEPRVRQFLWDDLAIERDRARDTVRELAALAPRGLGLWTIALATDQALVGCAALSPVGVVAEYYPPFAGAVEPLIALAPTHWGCGYAHEALTTLLAYATDTLRLDRVVAACDAPNEASDRLLRRTGFVCCAETEGPRYRLRHYTYG